MLSENWRGRGKTTNVYQTIPKNADQKDGTHNTGSGNNVVI
jgi:hypothetical protein